LVLDRKNFEKIADDFLSKLFGGLNNHFGIDVRQMPLDHLCWRCATISDFEEMEVSLLKMGSLFHKNIHNGRPISLIQLERPICYLDRKINLIELPSPKQDKSYPNGFEHAEFVYEQGLDALIKAYSELPWIVKNKDKVINPDIKLSYNNLSVKFHPYTLRHVVKNLDPA